MTKLKLASQQPKPYPTGEIPTHGDVVRIQAGHLGHFSKEVQARLVGRLGYIRNFSYGESVPVVMFDGVGRRKPFELGQVATINLEFVSRKDGVKPTKFSRGPWKTLEAASNHYVCPQEENSPICLVTPSPKRTPELNAANCALVVDAPIFHETLSALVAAMSTDDKASVTAALETAKKLLEKHP